MKKKYFIVHAVSKHFVQHGRARRTYVQKLQSGESGSPRDRQGEAASGAPAPGHRAASAAPAASHFGRRWVIRSVSRLLWGQQPRSRSSAAVYTGMTPPDNRPADSSWYGCVLAAVNRKDDPLLALLKSVYVDSTDPAPAEVRRGYQDTLGSFLLSYITDTKQLQQVGSVIKEATD